MNKRIKIFFATMFAALSTFGSQAADYNIISFGAVANGKVVNTKAIQAAIDRCSADGGGRVVIPQGVFVSGTLHLKNDVILHIEQGARLQGSSNTADYTQNLIRGIGVSNIGITGSGTIDGAGPSFWVRQDKKHFGHVKDTPGMLMRFEGCSDMRFEDVRIQNSPSWTMHLLGCEKVVIRGITIRNPLHGASIDGIDLQATRDVIISDCDIYTSDDAIVLKNRLSQFNHLPCSNITVTNCILTTACNGFKIGTETIGAFGNIVFSNSTIRNALPEEPLAKVRFSEMEMPIRAISGISLESVDGSIVDGVTITNITMEDVRVPIFIRLANRGAGTQPIKPTKAGEIKNVIISNVTATHAWYASSITAIPGSYVENLILDNIIVRTAGGGDTKLAEQIVDEKIADYPDAHMWKELPASAFYLRHVKNVDIKSVMVSLDAPDKRPAMIFDDVVGLNGNSLRTDANPNGEAAIRLTGVVDAKLSSLSLSPNVKFDLDIRGTENRKIRIADTAPAKVKATQNINKRPVYMIEID